MDKELLEYRAKLIRDASGMKTKPDRVPHISFFVTWKIQDAGYKLTQALADYDLMRKIQYEHQEKYQFDGIVEMGNRNQYLLVQHLGDSQYIYNDENDAVEYQDTAVATHEQLKDFAEDPKKYIWEKAMPYKFSFWNKDDPRCNLEFIQKAVDVSAEFGKYSVGIMYDMYENYSIPMPARFGIPAPFAGIEFMFSQLRGIKGLSIDMRRDPQLLDAAIDAFNAIWFYPNLELMKQAPAGIDPMAQFDMSDTILAHTIMNTKQWEKYFWPYLKMKFDVYAEKGWNTRYFTEGQGKMTWDYIKDYPKGTITLHMEQEDIFEAKKLLPNACMMGGLRNDYLGLKTKEQCVDLAKALIDEVGFNGGYIMSQPKLGTFKTDAKGENLKAVSEFLHEYRPSQN